MVERGLFVPGAGAWLGRDEGAFYVWEKRVCNAGFSILFLQDVEAVRALLVNLLFGEAFESNHV